MDRIYIISVMTKKGGKTQISTEVIHSEGDYVVVYDDSEEKNFTLALVNNTDSATPKPCTRTR